jgi:hypothetical protein
MTHVGTTSFGNRIEINIDDTVKVVGNDFCDIVQLLEIVFSVADECRESEGSKVADGCLVRGRVFDDLRAKIR